MRSTYFIIYMLLLGCVSSHAQTHYTEGNLVRISVLEDEINPADTLCKWSRYDGNEISTASDYIQAFRTDNETYLVYSYRFQHEFFVGHSYQKIVRVSDRSSVTYSEFSALDGFFFDAITGVYPVENGFWLIEDITGYAFVSTDDSITVFESYADNIFKLVHIAGELNGKHLCYFEEYDGDELFRPSLVDLSDSPLIDSAHTTPIKLTNDLRLKRIEKAQDCSYLANDVNGNLGLYTFSNDSLALQKTILAYDFYATKWKYRPPYIYAIEGWFLVRYGLSDFEIIDKDTLLYAEHLNSDVYFKYAVYMQDNNIKLFDIEKSEVIKSWQSSGISVAHKPVISYPDIFVHQITLLAALEEPPDEVPREFSFKAYPNPFNGSVKIELFITSPAGTRIEIYNTAGQRVKLFETGGLTHELVWRPSADVPSGIFFIRAQHGDFVKIQKVLYTK